MGISYSVETDPDADAKAMLRERHISLKHSKAIAREIKGRPLDDAREYLEAVVAGERAVPFKEHNSGVGHRSDLEGWDAGRYPEAASEAFLTLLGHAANNAEQAGLQPDGMVIHHVAPHKVGEIEGTMPRARGRSTPSNTPEVDIEIVLRDPDEAQDTAGGEA
ncbi:MAG: 50S ribosomal protein L22 [Halobacteriaceae archaeon]